MKSQKSPDSQTHFLPIYMCLGLSVGTAIGSAAGNLAICMPIGLSIGMCIGALMDAKNRKPSDDASQPEDKNADE